MLRSDASRSMIGEEGRVGKVVAREEGEVGGDGDGEGEGEGEGVDDESCPGHSHSNHKSAMLFSEILYAF